MTAGSAGIRSGRLQTLGRGLVSLAVALGGLSTSSGQGRADYFNVETPVGQALAIARIANHDYLLVCNTPDDSVEVYDTDESGTGLPFLARIPVGLEPNSILWDSLRSRVLVSCFLGDSVDAFALSAPTGPASFSYTLDQTRNVGDEPMDLALTPDSSTLLVSFGSMSSSMGAFNAVTLEPVAPTTVFPSPPENILLQTTTGSPIKAVKEPRTIEISANKIFVLNHKGGLASSAYDFDVYTRDLTSGAVTAIGGLGSTNWNMRFTSGGDLYVVGGVARNDLQGGLAVSGAGQGFVESKLFRVKDPATANPTVFTRDINVFFSGLLAQTVSKPDALAMPTDLVVQEGSPARVFVAAYGSDRVGVITLVNPGAPKTWTLARIAIPVAPGSTNTRSGPRALVLNGERVYVLNRLDNSISILSAQGTPSLIETFALKQDPTPAHIRAGRPFLYSAELSGNGFVSCASCHADGRTDSLGWDLGVPENQGGFSAPFPTSFVDSPADTLRSGVDDHIAHGFNPNKGVMITQSLQGLLDTEVAPDVQDLVTNAPYHWRGDRGTFTDFNEAFATLMGLGDLFGGGGPSDPPMGITQAQMDAFEEFVNSIHYPPNPKQLETREFSGSMGTNPDDDTDGTLALRGLKIFHMRPSLGGRSCAQCHALPRGSNLKFTDRATDADGLMTPLETAQLRGVFQRESKFQVDGYDPVPPGLAPVTGAFGLSHNGGRDTLNLFINLFSTFVPDSGQRNDLKQFVHQFDWGVAPVVGKEQRVTIGNKTTQSVLDRLALFEDQVELGNCGLAVGGIVASGLVGYWYDPTRHLYVQEASPATPPISRAALLALLTAQRHRMFFRCTPLGSERRLAATDGSSTPLADAFGPINLQLLPMVTNTAWAPVPTLTKNWIPGPAGGMFFHFTPLDPSMPTPRFARALREFQCGLVTVGGYGLTALRHDAPRRFRVAGDHILPGARLVLWTPNDTSGAQPDTAALQPDPAKTRRLEFPLYATEQTSGGSPVWETAVELAPIQYYALLNGGIEAPGVRTILDDAFETQPSQCGVFDPDHYNWQFVQVVNPDAITGNGGWQQLKLQ